MKPWVGVVVLLVATTPLAAGAGELRTQFSVTATVSPRASVEPLTQPAQLSISEVDVERGYVDVAAAYRVSSNDPSGYMVRLAPRVGLTRSVEVAGLSSPIVMTDQVVEVVQPAARRPQRLDLRFRLVLDDSAVPGTYAMPVQVSVATL
jgi:hypothetical protein